jgi:DNA-binding transcriptional LysR family regulator
MDTEYLKRFVTLASMERINFSRAADILNIPQPHLTQQIKRLEQEVGAELFDRSKRPAKLTPAGQVFLQEACEALIRLDRAKLSAQSAGRGEVGHLHIGINISLSNSRFPELLLAFRDRFPSVELRLHETIASDQISQLQNQRLDIGFFHLYDLEPFDYRNEFESLAIAEESLMVVLPERHPLAQQTAIKVSDLKDEPFVLPSLAIAGFRHQIINLCQKAGFFPKMQQEATWTTTSLSMVACEVGITILPSHVQNLQRSGVVYRAIKGESPKLQIVAVWSKGSESKVLQNFIEVIKQRKLG